MIASCPKCGARYRIERSRLRPEGARVRCSRCEVVFRVCPPPQQPAGERSEAPTSAPPEPPAAQQQAAPPEVVIADSDVALGSATANTLVAWGLRPIVVHDGVDAILAVQRTLPAIVILDAALPKMFGFQVCELMKRNESLRSIRVVLVGAIHHRDRYRRAPSDLYGADVYVERQELPEALRPILQELGLLAGAREKTMPPPAAPPPVEPPPPPAAVAPEGRPPESEPAAVAAPPEPAPAPAQEAPSRDDSLAEQVAAAERLARIIVSDVVLYNEEKFAAAVRSGNVVEALRAELQEGRAHFQQRIDARVRESKDFLADELLRVARTRGSS
ncbi:MAG: zinc-ribbon domain-containing protein [Myxococcales bacterium]|nr:zinc-ribbon domain-containing protein [Myxococcales bacterium]